MTFRYLQLDVFTPTRFVGNQLAVFPQADALSDREMQAIAKEMNFSETTFVLPPSRPDCDVRVRIFTPAQELPMAGHPTIGTAFALAHEGVLAAGRERVTFDLKIGPTPVELEWKGSRLHFAWMDQLKPTFGPTVADPSLLLASLGLTPSDLHERVPLQEVSCGLPFLFVPLGSRRAVDEAVPDSRGLGDFFRRGRYESQAVFVFTLEPAKDDATVYSRMFASTFGITEDPATGSASGPLGCYLVRYGLVEAGLATSMLSLQGVKMGRPSRIHIAIDVSGGDITRVRVGGQSVLVAEGTLRTTDA